MTGTNNRAVVEEVDGKTSLFVIAVGLLVLLGAIVNMDFWDERVFLVIHGILILTMVVAFVQAWQVGRLSLAFLIALAAPFGFWVTFRQAPRPEQDLAFFAIFLSLFHATTGDVIGTLVASEDFKESGSLLRTRLPLVVFFLLYATWFWYIR